MHKCAMLLSWKPLGASAIVIYFDHLTVPFYLEGEWYSSYTEFSHAKIYNNKINTMLHILLISPTQKFNAKACQHSVNNYFNNELVEYGEVCRNEYIFGRFSKVNMYIGTFCIPMNFIQHHTYMGANVHLAVTKRFYLSFSFILFRLHGGPVCRKDLVYSKISISTKKSIIYFVDIKLLGFWYIPTMQLNYILL